MSNIGSLKEYDAAQVTLIVADLPIDSGLDKGAFLTVEQDSADYEDEVGADGEVARSRTNDRRATIKVKLMQTSDGNTRLTALQNTGLITKNGADVGAFMCRDRVSGARMYSATKCWISKAPDAAFGSKTDSVEWTIRVADLSRVDAGS